MRPTRSCTIVHGGSYSSARSSRAPCLTSQTKSDANSSGTCTLTKKKGFPPPPAEGAFLYPPSLTLRTKGWSPRPQKRERSTRNRARRWWPRRIARTKRATLRTATARRRLPLVVPRSHRTQLLRLPQPLPPLRLEKILSRRLSPSPLHVYLDPTAPPPPPFV